MKLQYILILGLVLFNALLITTSVFFPATTYQEGALDVANETNYSAYRSLNNPGAIFSSMFLNWDFGGILAAFGIIGGIGTILSRNVVPFAVCMGIGTFTGLFMNLVNVVYGISTNPVVTSIIVIVGVCIGLVITFDALEAMKGRAEI